MLLDRLLDALLPVCCDACGAPGAWLCPTCRAPSSSVVVERLGMRVVVAQDPPTPSAARALYALKYELQRPALVPLATLLAAALSERLGSSTGLALVPVPTDAARSRARGFDHAELLAAAAGQLLELPVRRVLARTRAAAHQVGLGRAARLTNLAGVFGVAGALPPERLILVDDVCTTGATLRAAAAALWAAGADRVGACCVFGRTR